jgi:hypothetical protein
MACFKPVSCNGFTLSRGFEDVGSHLAHHFYDYKPDGTRPQPTIVTWNLEEVGKNRTKVTLVHSGFSQDMEKHFKETTAGWNHFAAKLVQYCSGKARNLS